MPRNHRICYVHRRWCSTGKRSPTRDAPDKLVGVFLQIRNVESQLLRPSKHACSGKSAFPQWEGFDSKPCHPMGQNKPGCEGSAGWGTRLFLCLPNVVVHICVSWELHCNVLSKGTHDCVVTTRVPLTIPLRVSLPNKRWRRRRRLVFLLGAVCSTRDHSASTDWGLTSLPARAAWLRKRGRQPGVITGFRLTALAIARASIHRGSHH